MTKIKFELRQPGDSPKVSASIDWFEREGLKVERKSPHHLKIGPFNLYPDAGSWNSDFDPKRKFGGLEALKPILLRWIAENPPPIHQNPHPLRTR